MLSDDAMTVQSTAVITGVPPGASLSSSSTAPAKPMRSGRQLQLVRLSLRLRGDRIAMHDDRFRNMVRLLRCWR